MAFNIIYKSNDEEEEKKRKKLIEEGANQQLERNRQANEQFNRNYEERNNFFNNVGRVADSFLTGLGTTAANVGTGVLSVINDDPVNLATRSARDNLIGKIENTDLAGYAEKLKAIKNPTEKRIDWLSDIKRQNEAKIQNLQSQTDSEVAKNIIGFVPNLSQQAVNIGASLVNPGLGMAVATAGAKGSYLDVAKQRGMNEEESRTFSNIMAVVEGATEMIGINNITKGIKGVNALAKTGIKGAKKEIQKEIVDTAIKSYGKSILDNAVQEAITEPIQEAVADITAKKGDWNNVLGRSLESGFSGALTAAITGGASMGISTAVGYVQKVSNGYKPTQAETIQAVNQIYNEATENQKQVLNYAIKDGVEIATQQSILPTEENGLKSNVETNNPILDTAERNGIDIKDEKTRNNLETIQKFNENRGIKASFDADAFKGHDNVNSFFRTDENGNREIVFNPNTMTDKTIQQLAVHEVYHDMVAGGTANELTDLVVQKMSGNQEYQDYINALQDVYGEQDSNIIKEEAVAHYLEKNLGTNEFITELQERGDRTTIQKIIDAIKDMITKVKNTLTGKGDLNYLLDLQRKYEQAYRGEFKGTQEQTKLSKQVNEYQGSHQIDTENSTSLNNLDLNDIESKVKQVNGALSKQDISDLNKLKKLKENDTITIYRASPVNELNNGDWVTTDKSYAQNVAKENGGKVYSYEVNANELLYPNNVKDLPSLHRLSSFQYNSQDNIQENTISNQPTTDNQGRTLTTEQQDYFKDSKVRDENGNLLEVYHGTNGQFNQYRINRFGKTDSGMYGKGFYFTNEYNQAKYYGNKVKKQYLDIKNPLYIGKGTKYENSADFVRDMRGEKFDRATLWEQVQNGTYKVIDAEEITEMAKSKGYDGIIVRPISGAETEYIAFNSNQIKNVDNTNPTENADIRYSKEAPTKDNQGRELSKGQQERLKNTKAVDEDGNVLELYHFTPSGDFTIFDKTRANPESDMGAGFYFTNSEIDGQQNYQDENGADIRNRINRLAEQIENEEDITYEEAREKAEQQVLQGGSSFNVYLDIENPAYIGGENETRLFTQDDIREYAEENDLGYDFENEEDAYDNALADYVENITNDLYDTYSFDEVQQIQRAIYDAVYENDFEGINVQQLKDKLNDPDNFIEIYDDNGNLVTNEIARQIVENIGYDGIIDNTVSSKFNMNLDPDTTHYIVFRPEQIKNVTNVNPTDNPDINLSKQGTGTAIKDLARVQKQSKQILPTIPAQQTLLNRAKAIEELQPEMKGLTEEIQGYFKDYNAETYAALDEMLTSFEKNNPKDELKVNMAQGKYGEYDADLRKYKQNKPTYNKQIVNNALSIVRGKQVNGTTKRTKAEWLRTANLIGQNAANLTNDQVRDLAYGTWLDLAPNNKETLNRQGEKYVKFTSDEWANEIYNAVEQNRTETTPKKQILPTTPAEEVTEMERPQLPQSQKSRKFYRSVIESDNTTAEAKQISRELMGYDSYTPQTNKLTLEQADRNIELNGTEGSLTTLTNKINNNDRITATDIAIGQRLMQYYSKIGDKARLQEAIQDTAMAGTEAGRSVQAFAMLNHQTPEGQVTWIQRSIDKINKRLQKEGRKEQFEFTPEMQQEILNSTDENRQQVLGKVYKELGKQVPKSHMEQFNEWRYFSMLFNPKTHFRNILGNAVMKQVQNMKNKVAGTIEDIVIGDNKERWNSLKRASKGTYEFAKNDLKNADVKSQLGLNENKYNPQNRLQQNQRTFKSNALENTLGRLFYINSKALEVEDGWGLKSAYAKAMANYLTANKLDYNNLTDTQLQKARNYAVQQAKEATFHQENLMANYLQTIEDKNLVTKIAVGGIVPFKKTPMNVALTGFEYSPAGFIKTFTSDIVNLRKGKISPNQFIDNISKNLTGTGIAVLGYALTQAGKLKASVGDDDKEKYEEARGKQNYSLQIGDNTYSLDWLTPAGIPLFIGSELYQISHKDEKETAKGENQALKSISSILDATSTAMNPMSEMSMISGLTSALKSYSQGSSQALANIGTNTLKSYVTQAVPTALGQIARTSDDKERSTTTTETNPFTKALDSTKNQIMSKIPGLRQLLPVSTDVWGNERKTTNYAENAILPWTIKEIKEEPLDKELTRLYDATGESSVIPDTYIDKTLTIAKEKYRLSNEEYADLKKQYGQTSYKILSNLTSSSDYKNMTDEQKVKAVTEAYKYAKASLKVTYADWNNLDADANSTYKKVQNVIDKGGDAKDYFTYVGLTDGLKTETEKNRALRDSDLGSKSAIYESTTGSDDQIYPIMKKAKTNINAYLDYKLEDIQGIKNEEGKTISGSKKQAFNDYLNSSKMNYNQKLLLKGVNYKLTNYEKNLLLDYLDTLKLSDNEYNDVLLKLK